jgi:Holliday junction DNA helicase RuvA
LKGVGEKTARKILGELRGHVDWIAESTSGLSPASGKSPESPASLARSVQDVLVRQFGHTPQEAQRLVSEALRRQPSISSMEELFQEVYRVGTQ